MKRPDGDTTICLDRRQANREILKEKYPIHTVEETIQEISQAKVFHKLDLNMAFPRKETPL